MGPPLQISDIDTKGTLPFGSFRFVLGPEIEETLPEHFFYISLIQANLYVLDIGVCSKS